jgi:putative ABC transport system substrate-binding protein
MRRRAFIAAAGCAALWPTLGLAQQSVPLVGFLSTRSPEESGEHTAAFLRGLGEMGYLPEQSVAIEYRWGHGDYEQLTALARDLASRRLAVLAAGGDAAALAARAASERIPLVFLIGDDPTRLGLVASLNRPGTNATGVSLVSSALGAKRLELLCELIPQGAVALLVNPTNPNAAAHTQEVQEAARSLGRVVLVVGASTNEELDTALASNTGKAQGLVVQNDPFFDAHRERLAALAAQARLPAIYHIREFPAVGGLMSYGPSLVDAYRDLGLQAGRVLKGVSASELPVIQPTKFELAINLNVAARMGLTVPPGLLARADEVIE